MQFTDEQIAKAAKAKSAEELFSIAKENGIELTEKEAAECFAKLHKEGELSDDELDAVAGGKGDDDEDDQDSQPKYYCLYDNSALDTYTTSMLGFTFFACPVCHKAFIINPYNDKLEYTDRIVYQPDGSWKCISC